MPHPDDEVPGAETTQEGMSRLELERAMSAPEVDFEQMSPAEKILHVQDLWDRIAETPQEVELTDEQRAELARRLEAHRADPDRGSPSWREVRDRVRARR